MKDRSKERLDGWSNTVDGWTNGWMDGRIAGWIDRSIDTCIHGHVI